MSVWERVITFIFGPSSRGENATVHADATERLFDYVFSLVQREDLISQQLTNRQKIRKISNVQQKDLAQVKLYFELENFILANKSPDVLKEFRDKKELRDAVREHDAVEVLPLALKLIFSPENQQAAILYNIGLRELMLYVRRTLGESELRSILVKTTTDTLLAGVTIQDYAMLSVEKTAVALSSATAQEVQEAFKKIYTALLQKITTTLGEFNVSEVVRKIYGNIADAYDQEFLAVFLDVVPDGFLESEKSSVLNRQKLEKMLQERAIELQSKVSELEHMNRLMVDRELKMIELKKENEALKSKKLN